MALDGEHPGVVFRGPACLTRGVVFYLALAPRRGTFYPSASPPAREKAGQSIPSFLSL